MPKSLQAQTIVIAGDQWCPINCVPNSEKPGFLIEVMEAIFPAPQYTVVYKNMPWERAIAAARAGTVNGIIGAYKSDAPDFIYPQNEQMMVSFNLYALQETSWQFTGISSLKRLTIGVVKGYSYLEQLDRYIERYKNDQSKLVFSYGNTPLQSNIKQLVDRRLDAIIANDFVLRNLEQQMKLESPLKQIAKLTRGEPAYIAFSPTERHSSTYAYMLSQGMDELRASGKLKQILKTYHLTDWR